MNQNSYRDQETSKVEEKKKISKITSKDGTKIAFEKTGHGPAIILVAGALGTRSSWSELPKLLESNFTIISYDRRGRGESTDAMPYSPAREIEDLEALIDVAGESAFLYAISSGGALALEAALKLGKKVEKVAVYEVPYSSDDNFSKEALEYDKQLSRLLSNGKKGEAVALFMKFVGVPDDMIKGMQHAPMWQDLEAVAPTLAYDSAVLGAGFAMPRERLKNLDVPVLVMDGGASPEFMRKTTENLTKAFPNALHRTLRDQTHDVRPEALAPALLEFFAGT